MNMAGHAPGFSVVIPVFNGEDSISVSIESVLNQTLPAEQVIVVDDGSTDGTERICRKYSENITYIRQGNAGVSAARNRGVEVAKCEWLAFLDADDYFYPKRLESYVRLLREYPDVDFITGDFDYIGSDGGWIRSSMASTGLGKRYIDQCVNGDFTLMQKERFGDFIQNHFGDTHTLSLPRETFLRLGGYNTKYQVCEDVHFLARLCAISRCAGVVCKPVAAYVIHDNSATRRDPLRAQSQTVAAMEAVALELENAAPELKAGLRESIRRARLDHAYSLLRESRKFNALSVVMVGFARYPDGKTLRDILSIIKGVLG